MLSILLLSVLQVTTSYPLCGRTKSIALRSTSICETKCLRSPACTGPFQHRIGKESCASSEFAGTGTRYFCSKSKSATLPTTKIKSKKPPKSKPKKKKITVPLCSKATDTDKACRIPCPVSIPDDIKHPIKTCSDYADFAIDTKQRCKSSTFEEHLCFRERQLYTKIKPEFVDQFDLQDFVDAKTGVVDYNNNQHLHPDTHRLSLDDILEAYQRFEALPAPGACRSRQAAWTQEERDERIITAKPEDFKEHKTFEKSLMKNTIYIFVVMQNDWRKMRLSAIRTDVILSPAMTKGRLLYPEDEDDIYPAGHTTLLTDEEFGHYIAGEKMVHYAGNILTAETDDGTTKIILWNNLSGHFFPSKENVEVFAAIWGWTEIEYKGEETQELPEYIPPSREFVCPPDEDDFLGGIFSALSSGSSFGLSSGSSFGSTHASSSLSGYDTAKQSLFNNIYDSRSVPQQNVFKFKHYAQSVYEPQSIWKNNYLIMWCMVFIGIMILILMCFLCMVTPVVFMVGHKIKNQESRFVETTGFVV